MAEIPAADKIALNIYEAAEREYSSENKRRRFGRTKHRRYLGMSSIGTICTRSLWYDFRSFTPKPMNGKTVLLFDDGNFYEKKLIQHLVMAGYPVENSGTDQLEFTDHDHLFCGHADGVIHNITHRPHILECKTANDAQFKLMQKNGVRQQKPTYYAQMQCYMGYADLDRALIVVYNKNTSEIYTERVHFNRQEFDSLREKALAIITAEDIPKRGHEPQSIECKWCNFRLHCLTDEGIIMADDRVCGNCWYLSWKGLKTCCRHPDHPFFISTWGVGCEDWSYLFAKDNQAHSLNRKPKVHLDEVSEATE